MKEEYLKEKNNHHSSMFTPPHPPQNFPPPQSGVAATTQGSHLLLHRHPIHSFQVGVNPRECQTSEEVESKRSSPASVANNRELSIQQPMHIQAVGSSGNDGASIEVVRRPRGRPPGSKNKPKSIDVIGRDVAEPSMSPYLIEVSGGVDIIQSVIDFCAKRNVGLSILNASGSVSNPIISHPCGNTVPLSFPGRCELITLSGTVIPPTAMTLCPPTNGMCTSFYIAVVGRDGNAVVGTVLRPLTSAGTVYLIASSFSNPSYVRLPLEDDQRNSVSGGGDGLQPPPSEVGHHPAASAISGGGGDDVRSHVPSSSTGMQYTQQSDAIWAPTARQPQQHPQHY